MARLTLTPPTTWQHRLLTLASRRMYGTTLDPMLATAHQPQVQRTTVLHELALARWRALSPRLTSLAVMAATHRIGCSWCTDFGAWMASTEGLSLAELHAVPTWRESELFDETDRAVLELAEAMSGEVDEVTDGQVSWLRERLGEPALVELVMMVAVENQRSRFNSALGLASQGFSERCEVRSGVNPE